MNKLKSDIKKIIKQECDRLTTLSPTVGESELDTAVILQMSREGVDLNEYRPEIVASARREFLEGKKKDYPPLDQLLLPSFDLLELEGGVFPIGDGHWVSLKNANYEQIQYRLGNQRAAAEAAAKTASNTEAILNSNIGMLMATDRNLTLWKALSSIRGEQKERPNEAPRRPSPNRDDRPRA